MLQSICILLATMLLCVDAFGPRFTSVHRFHGMRLFSEAPKSPSSPKVLVDVSYESDEEEDAIVSDIPLSPEEQYKKDKLAEIAEKKAQEVFMKRTTGKFECQACGYVYNTAAGLPKKGIAPGTPFDDIDKFRCPECGANKKYFVAETETVSGFKQNQNYGLGGNGMTGDQKGALIYGGLFLGFVLFLSGYLLE
jgi:rubredoxin